MLLNIAQNLFNVISKYISRFFLFDIACVFSQCEVVRFGSSSIGRIQTTPDMSVPQITRQGSIYAAFARS